MSSMSMCCSALDEAGTPEAKAELDRLHAAVNRPEDELADIADRNPFIKGWLDCFDGLVRDSHWRRDRALDPNGPIAPARLAHGGGIRLALSPAR
jgi:hypothetical protein